MKPKIPKELKALIAEARKNERIIKRLKKSGASNYEIAKAVGISEDEVAMIA